jgi:Ca2+-binding RTX toxin-like protein
MKATKRGQAIAVAVVVGAAIGSSAASTAAAATVAVVDGTVVFTASRGERNDVTARELMISDAAAPLVAGAGCAQLDAHTVSCSEPLGAAFPLTVNTGDRNDRAQLDSQCCRQLTLRGGSGADALTVFSDTGTPAELDGGPGDDSLLTNEQLGGAPVLRGRDGDDTLRVCCSTTLGGELYGGPGDDRLDWTGAVRSESFPLILDGGNGNDTYSFGARFFGSAMAAGVGLDTLDQSDAPVSLDFEMGACPGCVERVIGTREGDRIVGDDRAQAILGGDGDDALDGRGGSDLIAGQGGNDAIEARDGAIDAITCADGTDTVFADRFDPVSRDCETVSRGPGV